MHRKDHTHIFIPHISIIFNFLIDILFWCPLTTLYYYTSAWAKNRTSNISFHLKLGFYAIWFFWQNFMPFDSIIHQWEFLFNSSFAPFSKWKSKAKENSFKHQFQYHDTQTDLSFITLITHCICHYDNINYISKKLYDPISPNTK